MCDTKFLVDSMSGKLARWLRILGCDTEYVDPSEGDSLILRLSTSRILVTRDRELVKRAINHGIRVVSVPERLEEALAILSASEGVRLKIEPKKSRCPFCNTKLNLVRRAHVVKGLPREVLRSHIKFLVCTSCGNVFWFGTHYWNMLRTLSEVKKKKGSLRFSGGPVMTGDGNDS
ncbi:MAG: Mut7-C RNAse domain-containing protein [Candidatus Korarchaeota archaeon]|nr:Mut7-C RNAse domain-containing protein [Candidatus Korarchaeota archaeon]